MLRNGSSDKTGMSRRFRGDMLHGAGPGGTNLSPMWAADLWRWCSACVTTKGVEDGEGCEAQEVLQTAQV